MHRLVTAGKLQQPMFLIFQALGAEAHARIKLGIVDSDRAEVVPERIKAFGDFIPQLVDGGADGAGRQSNDA